MYLHHISPVCLPQCLCQRQGVGPLDTFDADDGLSCANPLSILHYIADLTATKPEISYSG